jgi:hypothetical protein
VPSVLPGRLGFGDDPQPDEPATQQWTDPERASPSDAVPDRRQPPARPGRRLELRILAVWPGCRGVDVGQGAVQTTRPVFVVTDDAVPRRAEVPCAIRRYSSPTLQALDQVWAACSSPCVFGRAAAAAELTALRACQGTEDRLAVGIGTGDSVPWRPLPTRAARFVALVAVLHGGGWASRAA